MKMLLVVHHGADARVVTDLFDRHQVQGWAEIGGAHGAGVTGRLEGTRAWPGEAAVYFSIVDDARADALADALAGAAHALPAGERLHVSILPVERFF